MQVFLREKAAAVFAKPRMQRLVVGAGDVTQRQQVRELLHTIGVEVVEGRLGLVALEGALQIRNEFVECAVLLVAVERIGTWLVVAGLDGAHESTELVLEAIVRRRGAVGDEPTPFVSELTQYTSNDGWRLLEAEGNQMMPLRATAFLVGRDVYVDSEFVLEKLLKGAVGKVEDVTEAPRPGNEVFDQGDFRTF